MSDSSKPFAFSNFVPGFDFLKNIASGAAAGGAGGALAGLPGISSWVAPTLSVEEVDKRIQELKAVQFWLDQNVNALKATVQALEVQKMTLSTLKGMNVRMEDLASAFTRNAGSAMPGAAAAPAPAAATPAPEPQPSGNGRAGAPSEPSAAAAAAGMVDPLQWWGALTQQFEQIASTAMRDAANLKMPAALQTVVDQATGTAKKRAAPARRSEAAAPQPAPKAASKRPAAKRAPRRG